MIPWHEGRICEEKSGDEQAAKEARIKNELALDDRRLEADRALQQLLEEQEGEDDEEAAEAPAQDARAAEEARIADERAREEARKKAQLKEKHTRDEDASTQTLKIYKACPGCGIRVEKTSGCDHITCTRCSHQFCLVYLADHLPILDEGNHRHNPDCMHYRPLGRRGSS